MSNLLKLAKTIAENNDFAPEYTALVAMVNAFEVARQEGFDSPTVARELEAAEEGVAYALLCQNGPFNNWSVAVFTPTDYRIEDNTLYGSVEYRQEKDEVEVPLSEYS